MHSGQGHELSVQSLFRVSTRGIVVCLVAGLGCAVGSVQLVALFEPAAIDESARIATLPVALIGFVLGAGAALTLYFVLNFLRYLLANRRKSE
ncbi:MAG: hypothetical protein RIC89_13210 [Pseudomonadales bacterium]